MRRREFINVMIACSTIAWPLAVYAKQAERRIGMLLPAAADDAHFQAFVGAFLQELALLGWTIGRNMRIDTRCVLGIFQGVPGARAFRRHLATEATKAEAGPSVLVDALAKLRQSPAQVQDITA
jgi:hypothetical protein